ncbi:hypothetical protein EON67_02680 [archaeon]|nr:MAG: hypothetical protein EON67_02680 [archaeon]
MSSAGRSALAAAVRARDPRLVSAYFDWLDSGRDEEDDNAANFRDALSGLADALRPLSAARPLSESRGDGVESMAAPRPAVATSDAALTPVHTGSRAWPHSASTEGDALPDAPLALVGKLLDRLQADGKLDAAQVQRIAAAVRLPSTPATASSPPLSTTGGFGGVGTQLSLGRYVRRLLRDFMSNNDEEALENGLLLLARWLNPPANAPGDDV